MKKQTVILVLIFVFLLLGGYFIFNIFIPKTDIKNTNASIKYIYMEKNINTQLTAEESEIVKSIFNNKRLYPDNPSCGFDENVSICFDDMIFCIACDKCPIIKYKNRYFSISRADRETIEQIFEKYGGKFPCL